MAYKCSICDEDTIFYIWSTTRDFPLNKLSKILDRKLTKNSEPKPVCFRCCKEKLGINVY